MPWPATILLKAHRHELFCAVTVYWVALAWLGEMILAARTMQPSITRRIDGPKDVHGALLEVSKPGSEWVCQADRRLVMAWTITPGAKVG
jgi:hypothetical protein